MCLGNICRSPLAEAIYAHKIKENNLSGSIACSSAGTADYHVGSLPDTRSMNIARVHSIPIQHRGQQFRKSEGESFDYLIAMDKSNYANMIEELGNEPSNLFLMRDFDGEDKGADVPDPYHGSNEGFEKVYQILDRSLNEFISFLRDHHDLQA